MSCKIELSKINLVLSCLVPQWVESRFRKLVYHFLGNSKIKTVSRQTLSAPVKDGGLGILDFSCKSNALKVSIILAII